MRLLHTSDWHLGHHLHEQPRDYEHQRFLTWLVDTLAEEAVDALIIAGDIFDTANPSAASQAAWYGFLADLRERLPRLDVVVIGGNHDSGARLDAPVPLLRHMRIHIVGSLPRRPAARRRDRAIDLARVVVPLFDASGEVAAHLAAVPFLRPADLPRPRRGDGQTAADDSASPTANPVEPGPDPLIWGVREIYRQVLDEARARCTDGQALLATGHCYMVGTELSRLSERAILGGNQHALPADIFPDDVAYAALGHLHKAQRVGQRDSVRYAGAPIPLSLAESRNRQQVLLADFDGPQLVAVRSLPVPRSVDIVRVPRAGAITLDELPAALAALEPLVADEPREMRPYLGVHVALARPEVRLRAMVDEALADRRPRLARLAVEYTGDGAALADAMPSESLRDLEPGEVFVRRYRRDHEERPSPELLAAFHDLLDAVARGDGP